MSNQPDEAVDPAPVAEPTLEELLLARIDAYERQFGLELDLLEQATEQLEPQRAVACRQAIGRAREAVAELGPRTRGEGTGL
jgi:hypothetical protein